MIKEIRISGFRGFGSSQTIPFAIPDAQKSGSGLTIITGANNAGKTTIIEAIRAFNGSDSPSFSEGRRNKKTSGIVNLQVEDSSGEIACIKSIPGGGSSTQRTGQLSSKNYILPSRRAVPFEFSRSTWTKDLYMTQAHKLENQRASSLDNFNARIFQIEKHKKEFDGLITRILGDDFQWTVEQRDSGNYYIKYTKNNVVHSSEGVGDGIWSIFTICAALFDAEPQTTIVIDEPELSVHPSLQKRLMTLFIEYAQTRQIVICTHSPYFINWAAIINGAQLVRIVKEGTDSKCYCLSNHCRSLFEGIAKDLNNPHTLGLEANEVFFLEDRIILVEGQEDVVIFKKIEKELDLSINGDFFGWGVGGAPKMRAFLALFRDMGYRHVVSILDGDKVDVFEELKREYSETDYKFFVLPTDDIRDKKERTIQSKSGITSEKGNLKSEYKEPIRALFNDINDALK